MVPSGRGVVELRGNLGSHNRGISYRHSRSRHLPFPVLPGPTERFQPIVMVPSGRGVVELRGNLGSHNRGISYRHSRSRHLPFPFSPGSPERFTANRVPRQAAQLITSACVLITQI